MNVGSIFCWERVFRDLGVEHLQVGVACGSTPGGLSPGVLVYNRERPALKCLSSHRNPPASLLRVRVS